MALIKILIPSNTVSKEMYLKGFLGSGENIISIYLTSYLSENTIQSKYNWNHRDNVMYCYCGAENKACKGFNQMSNKVFIENIDGKIQVKQLVLDKKVIETNNVMLILYDYNKFRDSETLNDTGDDFYKLQRLLQFDNKIYRSKSEKTIQNFNKPFWLITSMFLQHIFNYLNVLRWLWISVKRDKKISLKQSNLLLAIITDIILGYVLLNLVMENTKQISSQVMELLERLINMLHSLLTWLMGAPVGLKLNNAFNKMLGQYFSYHVQLWWLFLDTSSKRLDVILNIYHYIGYLGFTFQIAVLSDMICIATFHSYCIYVYAARLFNIQVSGLIALLRLFVGRKYNPLRGGIDSCEYTNQELFVGTVAFTVLLLLLPTTTMYYIVFTVFRTVSLAVQHILAKIIYIVQTLPIYVTILWLVNSPKISGNILVEVEHQQQSGPLVIKVQLLRKSLFELIRTFRPPVEVPNEVEWTNLLSNALIGKQIT